MFPDFWGTDTPIPPAGSFDVERILAQVRAVSLPQPASLIPKWVGTLGTDRAVADAKRGLMANKAVGVGALLAAGAGLVILPPFAIAWIGLGFFGLFKLFGGDIDHAPFRSAFALADQRAREAELAFVQRVGLTELYGIRDDLEKWIASHRQLDTDLNRDLANLRSTAPLTITPKPSSAAAPLSPTHATATPSKGLPSCPRCGSPMTRRTARRGRQAGRGFWGCTRYPVCTGTRN